MDVTLLRTLTHKSKIGFGKYKEYTVNDIFKHSKTDILVRMYYKCSNISFVDDVLDDLFIMKKYRFKKPNTNDDLYVQLLAKFEKKFPKVKHILTDKNKELAHIVKCAKVKRRKKYETRGYMQQNNHGNLTHRLW